MWKQTRIAVLLAATLCVIGVKVSRASVWYDWGYCSFTDNGDPCCVLDGSACCTGDEEGTYCNAC